MCVAFSDAENPGSPLKLAYVTHLLYFKIHRQPSQKNNRKATADNVTCENSFTSEQLFLFSRYSSRKDVH